MGIAAEETIYESSCKYLYSLYFPYDISRPTLLDRYDTTFWRL